MRKLAVLSFFIVLAIVAAVPAHANKDNSKAVVMVAAAGANAQGKALFEKKCGVCHGLSLATSRTATKAQWKAIIADMQGKRAGWISDKEAAKILDYLSSAHGK